MTFIVEALYFMYLLIVQIIGAGPDSDNLPTSHTCFNT